MTDFWIGSDEWKRWWDPQPARVLRDVESDGPLELVLAELERTGEHVLIDWRFRTPVIPGSAVGVRIFRLPDEWDEHSPLTESQIRFASEPELYARPEEAPVVSQEKRERIRRGWVF